MELKKEIEKINKQEFDKIFNKYREVKEIKKFKTSLEIKKKYIFTMKKFEVFFRLYIDENIQVCIRTNTLNSHEQINYDFVNFKELQIDDPNEYKKIIRLFYKNIIKEVLNTLYCPEYHKEMIPDNATKEETDIGWYCIYEQRLLTELSYNKKEDFNTWIEKVTDKKYIVQQKEL